MMREVILQDAIEWLSLPKERDDFSFVTSLPDISEFPHLNLVAWQEWFISTARLVMKNTSNQGVSLFYQSDIKLNGIWINKAYLVQKAAELEGHQLLWHKIICRAPLGTTTFGRPAYSHILCFSKEIILKTSQSTPDVISEMGEKTWERGMGLEACLMIGKFISENIQTRTLVNPFCGEGSMLATANAFGLKAIGIERSPKRARKARALRLNLSQKMWELNESET